MDHEIGITEQLLVTLGSTLKKSTNSSFLMIQKLYPQYWIFIVFFFLIFYSF